MADGKPETTITFEDVVEKETVYIANRRVAAAREVARTGSRTLPQPDSTAAADGPALVGLALSGGGIRSATTNLGILQALAKHRILPHVDYLSTVSGGGYIGSCLSSLLSLKEDGTTGLDGSQAPKFRTTEEAFPFSVDQRDPLDTLNGASQLRHLRTHGNFLVARRGLFRRDALRAIGNIVTGMAYSVTIGLLALLVAAASIMTFAAGAGGNRLAQPAPDEAIPVPEASGPPVVDQTLVYCCPVDAEGAGLWDQVLWTLSLVSTDLAERSVPAGLLLLLALLLGAAAALLAFRQLRAACLGHEGAERRPGECAGDSCERAVLTTSATRLAVVTILLAAVPPLTLFVEALTPSVQAWIGTLRAPGIIWLFAPAALLLGARATGFALGLRLPGASRGRHWNRLLRSLWGAYQGIATYGLVVTAVVAVVPLLAFAAASYGVEQALGAVVSALAAWWLARRSGSARPGLPSVLAKPVLGLAVLGVLLLTVLAMSAALIAGAQDLDAVALGAMSLGLAVLVGLLLCGLGYAVDFNKISLHYFYRDRLVETYLQTDGVGTDESADCPDRTTVLRNTADLPLQELHGSANDAREPGQDTQLTSAPYHLISAAINLAGSRDLTRKDRQSGYWLFSKYFCGSEQTGYLETKDYRAGKTQLARAVTISGAAASSGMGSHTFFAQALATTLFNIRLGYWMENPAYVGADGTRATSRWEQGVWWHRFMLKEMFGWTTAQDRLVNLSDGGHTGDNLGIYPLLKRRCDVIIACDAEADPDLGFGSFTEALRHAYIDLDIEVDINLRRLREDAETGRSNTHCAIGRIKYPAQTGRTESVGWLILLKNSLTGDEPAPVVNYKQTHPDFPHETTADQFFDDSQFESYRTLGHHIATKTFEGWDVPPPGVPRHELNTRLWTLLLLHSPFKAAAEDDFQAMTSAHMRIERLFLENRNLDLLAAEVDAEFEDGDVATQASQDSVEVAKMCALMIQLMEQVYFLLSLGHYPNAPDNRGWMNLFRRWGRSPTLDHHFTRLERNYAKDFVDFYRSHLQKKNVPIDRDPIPHKWESEDGLLLDPGNS